VAKKKKKLFRFWFAAFLIFLFSGFFILRFIEKVERLNSPERVQPASPEKLKRVAPLLPERSKKDKIAILIDDLGPNLKEFRQIRNLHPNLSFAVLPFQPFSIRIAGEIKSAGNHDLLLHLPMEAESHLENPGKGAIYHAMKPEEIIRQTRLDLQAIPSIQGVNNHMGSKITSDPLEMKIILGEIKLKKLYFIDSRTTASSVAHTLAEEMGIRSAERQVFLDDTDRFEDIIKELDRLVLLAHQNGVAIAIGHPRPNTIRAIKTFLPHIDQEAIELVPVSTLVR
jgi:polysaccharide deacetylase 2 family uncharacterized protein YibQ